MLDTVIHSDCLAVLRGMADNSVDAIVSDPPGNLSFMGKSWDTFGHRSNFIAFMTEVMTEALRVLKPGGHALIWALPRTSHWTATALEDAGWEIRDVITHLFGSGFPKSLDISKAIDRMQGKEREVVGFKKLNERDKVAYIPHAKSHFGTTDEGKREHEREVTKPATPEAQQWAGYGSALKPAAEFWWLCRKPLAESSIAAQVLATGTGGLNIGQCRVGNEQRINQPAGNKPGGNSLHLSVTGMPQDVASTVTQGRFPSHLLMSHSLWCVPRGTKRVRGDGHKTQNHVTSNVSHFGNGHTGTSAERYNDPEGMETVEAYDCAPDCPIAELDRQSGVRPSSGRHGESGSGEKAGLFGIGSTRQQTYFDQGGASRYFQHFPPDDYTPFLYQSKASRAERNKGCEDLPLHTPAFGNSKGDGLGRGISNTRQDWPVQNTHPTVKPLALMRWLIRLITPPDGIVLDPFCGSGSTCVAAIHEGKHFIGIEQSSEYVAICEARIAHAQKEITALKEPSKGANLPPPNSWIDQSIAQEYDCAPDCPIRIIGEQSGVTKTHSTGPKYAEEYANGTTGAHKGKVYGKLFNQGASPYRDTTPGTAARYFQQFAPDLWTQDMQDAEEVFIAEGGYEGEVSA